MNNYLSPERFEELKQELETLKNEKRKEVAEQLKRAKEYGDLSENSEYVGAREEQTRVESRIFELDELLKSAKLIEKKGKGGGAVQGGSTGTGKKGGKTYRYAIVGSNESNPLEKKISNESPLGRAFLGKRAGDVVTVETPAGPVEYQVSKVE